MRVATVNWEGRSVAMVAEEDRVLTLVPPMTMKQLASASKERLDEIRIEVTRLTADSPAWIEHIRWEPAMPNPGAIYTIGLNYDGPGAAPRPDRPFVYGKASNSVAASGATVTWDRSLTSNVDAECELGVVIGVDASVFGYTIINDISSRDPWLDGDQWLLGKSMPGFCPVGPWIVTADEFDPTDVGLGCTINGEAIQDGRTSQMRFAIPEIIGFLSRHVRLEPGDLIATGTPVRLADPPGPDRHLEAGDVVTCWIEGIGELTTTVE
jgi:2-keto-4-pentenoate hydratase/2-oxohepta-3-ene-1,7-dioic acid hydratase in catechol pathway